MQQCTHCQRELANYKRSTMIPHTAGMYYISCGQCGNVMKAIVRNNEITLVQSTTEKKGLAARKEILETLDLFQQAGVSVIGYSVDNSAGPDVKVKKNKFILNRIKDFVKTVF